MINSCYADKGRGQFVPILSYSNSLHHQLNKLRLESQLESISKIRHEKLKRPFKCEVQFSERNKNILE
jgi:hypothetical protein